LAFTYLTQYLGAFSKQLRFSYSIRTLDSLDWLITATLRFINLNFRVTQV